MGRLRAGTSVETVAPALATVGRRLEQAFPDGQRRLHARDVRAFASHVHARGPKWRGDCDGRPAPDGHAGDRPARRVPQPRRSAAGSRSVRRQEIGHQVVTRRRPRAPHPAAAHRRAAPRAGRRRGRAVAVDVGDRRAAGVGASRAPRRLEPPRTRSRLASARRDRGVQSDGLAGLRRLAGLVL